MIHLPVKLIMIKRKDFYYFFYFQFSTSSPATSPNISVSGSNMSPICSEEAPSVSPPLPPRLHASLPDSAPGSRLSSSLSDAPAGPPPHPSPQFPGLDPSNLAALSAGYPRLGGGMMGLGAAMPTLPYSSSDQNPYSSISMENFYSPLVSLNNTPVSKQHMHLPANFFSNFIKYIFFYLILSFIL